MARANFIKSARKSIYMNGKRVEYISKKGKREGQTLSKIDRTIPRDENDEIFINKGESYYCWDFMNGGTHYSKTKPRRSQLTQSSFLSQCYSIQERIEDWCPETTDDILQFVEELKQELEEMRDSCQESFDNIPEQLQDAPVGSTLQERIESLEDMINELDCFEEYDGFTLPEPFESIDDVDEDLLNEVVDENFIDTEEENWRENVTLEMVIEYVEEKQREYVEEKSDEIKGLSFDL